MVNSSPFNEEGVGLVPGREANIPYASWPKNQNIKQKQYYNKFNKDFKNCPHKKKIFKKNESTKSSLVPFHPLYITHCQVVTIFTIAGIFNLILFIQEALVGYLNLT